MRNPRVRFFVSPTSQLLAGATASQGRGDRGRCIFIIFGPCVTALEANVPGTVVVGVQWGDEGKGRIVDLLAAESDLVVRYQGGNNAGHTVWVGDHRYAFHLIPTGILRGKLSLLGAGMVIDLEFLRKEEQELAEAGVEVLGKMRISENAHLILPYHKLQEAAEEDRLGAKAIGTTRRGIGPAYEDKAARRGLRIGDLCDPNGLGEKLARVVEYKNLILGAAYGVPAVEMGPLYDALCEHYQHYAGVICDTSLLVADALAGRVRRCSSRARTVPCSTWIGAPIPTSPVPAPCPGRWRAGRGLVRRSVGRVIGAAKAYTTRVGAGPFPTEMAEEIACTMREQGGEYGTTTGRARRIGWFDAVVVRKSARLNGLDSLAITHLDVLDKFDEIPLCVAYECDGGRTSDFPNDLAKVARCQPVYETMPGWKSDTSGARTFSDLPAQAQRYLRRIEELVELPMSYVLVGRQRDQSIVL